jgi:hypothetical protein
MSRKLLSVLLAERFTATVCQVYVSGTAMRKLSAGGRVDVHHQKQSSDEMMMMINQHLFLACKQCLWRAVYLNISPILRKAPLICLYPPACVLQTYWSRFQIIIQNWIFLFFPHIPVFLLLISDCPAGSPFSYSSHPPSSTLSSVFSYFLHNSRKCLTFSIPRPHSHFGSSIMLCRLR